MSVQMLERQTVDVDFHFRALENDIMTRAAHELSYRVGSRRNEMESVTADGAKVLTSLDIQPFTLRSVERYKNSVRRRFVMLCFVPLLVSLALFAPTLRYAIHHDTSTAWGLTCLFGITTFIATIGAFGSAASKTWREFALDSYEGAIPVYALQRALLVREAAEKVGLRVSFSVLQYDNREEPRYDADPFLVVSFSKYANKSIPFYLDVWDEPKFKGERQV